MITYRIAAFLFSGLLSLAPPTLALAHLASGQTANQYLNTTETVAKYSAKDFAPDGDLSKPIWKQAHWVEFDHDPTGTIENPAIKTRVAAVWSDRYIYFAFSGHYESLNIFEGEDVIKERWELWNRDVVEVFLNPEPNRISHYYEFEVAPNNQWIDLEIDKTKTPFNDPSWNSKFEHATKINEKQHLWLTEMRIPLSAIGVDAIHSGDIWRVNFFRAAGHGGDDHRVFLAWGSIPQGGTFHVPNRFGILGFVKQPSAD